MNATAMLAGIWVFLGGGAAVCAQTVLFVDSAAAPGGVGLTWGTAFDDLQDGIDAAGSLVSGGATVQIWVAGGTYRPDRGSADRMASFQLIDGAAIYGGFAGNETQLQQRNIASNPTILSGDLLGNDPASTVNVFDPRLADNSVHVVVASGAGPTAVLDGFTITRGVAYVQNGTFRDGVGGAVFNEFGSPVLRRCTLTGNLANWQGGAVFNWISSSPTLEQCVVESNHAQHGGGIAQSNGGVLTLVDCTIADNSASQDGGGILFAGVLLNATGCTFRGNVAVRGAAVLEDGYASEYTGCVFVSNTATSGAVLNAKNSVYTDIISCEFRVNRASSGTVIVDDWEGVLTLDGTLFEGNVSTGDAGAIYLRRGQGAIVNCTFRDNIAGGHGGAVFCDTPGYSIESCVFENNQAILTGGAIKAHSLGSITSCDFRGNSAISGGALWTDSGQVLGCTFSNNSATNQGGAVLCDRDAVFEDCLFESNTADSGGAFFNDQLLNATISNTRFVTNSAVTKGGALATFHSSVPRDLTLSACVFQGNEAPIGGAMHSEGTNAVIISCRFEENSATGSGGAVFNALSDPTFTLCAFSRNTATGSGGAVYSEQNSDSTLVNCLLDGNDAADGGALYGTQFSDVLAINCTIVANVATGVGGGVALLDNGEGLIRNCIVWGNTDRGGAGEGAQIHLDTGAVAFPRYSCIDGWTGSMGGVGNHGEDPQFRDELGPDGIPGTGDEDLRLVSGSPGVDAGETSSLPASLVVDLDGLPRVVDDPLTPDTGPGPPPIVDMGVYELQLGTCYADCDQSTGIGVLDIFDFLCFQQSFVAGEPYACDCDVSTGIGVCDVFDFLCFQSAFVTGCP